jgi:hypothetical protein
MAHDELMANEVKRSGKDPALAFRRLRKREDCEAKARELAAREGGIEGASPAERKLANFKNHRLLGSDDPDHHR